MGCGHDCVLELNRLSVRLPMPAQYQPPLIGVDDEDLVHRAELGPRDLLWRDPPMTQHVPDNRHAAILAAGAVCEPTPLCPGTGDSLHQCETFTVPLVDVTYDDSVGEDLLLRLRQLLPDVIAEAVAWPEQPWIGPPEVGDLEIRFRRKSHLDFGELNVVIEVRTKLFDSRASNKQQRADLVRDRLAGLPLGEVGVWLILSEGAWSQS